MDKEKFAVYERSPRHGKDFNGVIMAPFDTKEKAEEARKSYGYDNDNYYVDILDYKKSKIMNKEQAKDALLKIYEIQIMDLTLMSKIELGDDVIAEIKRLKQIINE